MIDGIYSMRLFNLRLSITGMLISNTVDVRKPDVRFAKPDKKRPVFECPAIGRPVVINLFGYRTSIWYQSVWNPDINVRYKRLKSGHLCPDFRHKPVWNRFWYWKSENRFQTGLEPVLVLVVRFQSIGTGRPITGDTNWNRPDVR